MPQFCGPRWGSSQVLCLCVTTGADADLGGDVVAIAPRDTRLLQHVDDGQSFAARSRQREQIGRRIGDAHVTPGPATLPLFATGVGASALLGWRWKRKSAAAIAAD